MTVSLGSAAGIVKEQSHRCNVVQCRYRAALLE